jgi:hypothetical protein
MVVRRDLWTVDAVTVHNTTTSFEFQKERKSYKNKQWRPPSKTKTRGINPSPRNMKARHSVSTALLQSVVETGVSKTGNRAQT